MPIWLLLSGAGLSGAYIATQIDDFSEWWNGEKIYHAASAGSDGQINPTKIFIYAAGAIALVWGAKKAGLLK